MQRSDVVIRTDRVALRPWRAADAATLAAITNTPSVVRHVGGGRLWSDDKVRDFIARQQRYQAELGFCLWAVLAEGSAQPGGYVGMQPLGGPGETGEIEIGWVLDEPLWGRGLATEAARATMQYGFGVAGLPRIVAIAEPTNSASINVMRKLGMEYERRLIWKGFDVVLYARTGCGIGAEPVSAHDRS